MNSPLPSAQKIATLSPAAGSSVAAPRRGKLVELAPTIEEVATPMPAPARRRRPRGAVVSFVLLVLLPVIASCWYLAVRAQDQFASTAAFAIRSEEPTSGLDLLSGFSALSSSSSSDVEILNLFLTSQDLVNRVAARVDLRAAWGGGVADDPVFSFHPDGTVEDLTQYWQRMVHVHFDASSGLIEVQVRAFTAQDALQIAQAILTESTHLINHMSDDAEQDMVRSATEEHMRAKMRLKTARLDVAQLRARTGMADPVVGLSGDTGVLQRLQESLADEMVKLDLLKRNQAGSRNASGNDVRIAQHEIKIDVLEGRIAQERDKYSGTDGKGYSDILAQFEEVLVDQRFAEEAYVAATAALDLARADARRSSRYLAVFVNPSLAERAMYPQRIIIALVIGGFALLAWALGTLLVQSLRDRRPV